jgi:nucleoside 2-deoxyribosyltransferase
MKKLYLAGPDVFHPEPLLRAKVLKNICEKYEFEGVFPSDISLQSQKMTLKEMSRFIFKENERLILESDGILANMQPFRGPSMDAGTAYELGFAHAHKKPIVGYTFDFRDYKEKVEELDSIVIEGKNYVDDWTVEDFGLVDNLMVVYSTLGISDTIEGALEKIQKHFYALEGLKNN